MRFGDSVLVVADSREKLIWRIDLRSKTRTEIGSQGQGPGEYSRIGMVVKHQQDSIALLIGSVTMPIPIVDVISGRGRTITVVKKAEPLIEARQYVLLPVLRYADTSGNFYGSPLLVQHAPKGRNGRPRRLKAPDIIPIVRYNAATGKSDTIIRLPSGVLHADYTTDSDGTRVEPLPLGPYGAYNSWTVTESGHVITADASTYTLQILDSTGAIIKRVQIPSARIPVSKSHWKEYVDGVTGRAATVTKDLLAELPSGFGITAGRLPAIRYSVPQMPREMPQLNFEDGKRRIFVFDSTAWLPVHLDDLPGGFTWDIVDLNAGSRLATVSLPDNEYLSAVTDKCVYVIAIDDDGLQRLVKYQRNVVSNSVSSAYRAN